MCTRMCPRMCTRMYPCLFYWLRYPKYLWNAYKQRALRTLKKRLRKYTPVPKYIKLTHLFPSHPIEGGDCENPYAVQKRDTYIRQLYYAKAHIHPQLPKSFQRKIFSVQRDILVVHIPRSSNYMVVYGNTRVVSLYYYLMSREPGYPFIHCDVIELTDPRDIDLYFDLLPAERYTR